jgi:hypothetical protein
MLEAIQSAYAFFEQMHVTVTGLVVAIVLFALAFLFAIREAASWFFKVDDIKRDIGRLKEISLQLESEVRLIQGLVTQTTQALQQAQAAVPLASEAQAQPPAKEVQIAPFIAVASSELPTPTPLFTVAENTNAEPVASASESNQASSAAKTSAFPIVH